MLLLGCLLQYLSLLRAVGSILELSEITESMKSMAQAPHDERLRIVAEREQHCEQVAAVLRTMKERIERKDELLQGYEKDLAKLRSVQFTMHTQEEVQMVVLHYIKFRTVNECANKFVNAVRNYTYLLKVV